MTILIANKRNGSEGEYIGRPSPLGNPFKIGECGSRERVIETYRTWLGIALRNRAGYPETNDEFDRLSLKLFDEQHLTLLCWCSPLPCHGDVIADFLENKDAHTYLMRHPDGGTE